MPFLFTIIYAEKNLNAKTAKLCAKTLSYLIPAFKNLFNTLNWGYKLSTSVPKIRDRTF